MYQPKSLRVASIMAIVLSLLGLVASGILMTQANGIFFMAVLSWAVLLWASIISFQLTKYPLEKDDLKKLGIRIYLIIIAFLISAIVGVIIGILLSVALLAAVWGMKRNYDEWDNTPAE